MLHRGPFQVTPIATNFPHFASWATEITQLSGDGCAIALSLVFMGIGGKEDFTILASSQPPEHSYYIPARLCARCIQYLPRKTDECLKT